MNFFEAQDKTRRNTRRLVVIYVIATFVIALLVGLAGDVTISFLGGFGPSAAYGQAVPLSPLRTGAIGLIALAVILLATAYRITQLRGGGARVAQEMGATQVSADIDDPLRQRLRNVVEEMAIASGVPVPDIFVMENEAGINAFAAGFSPTDAAIAVTRGALEQLTREELQGVVAHEFSHILNGDMRLNVRLIGVLCGIIVIGHIGRLLMRSASHRGGIMRNRRSNNGANVAVIAGVVLFLLGAVGVFTARLIRAGVSRQREYLADASAVQFTRQTEGIAGALAKIGGLDVGSRLRTVDSEEVSHMLIARGAREAWLNAMASHPPLDERIRRLNPTYLLRGAPEPRTRATSMRSHALISALSDDAGQIDVTSMEPGSRIGNPGDSEIELAAAIRLGIPAELYDAAHSREWSFYLALALSLSGDPLQRDRQTAQLTTTVGDERVQRIRRYADQLDDLGSRFRLPLLELCFPALKQRPAGQLKFLLSLVETMHGLVGTPDLRDTVFRTTQKLSLDASIHPGRSERWLTTHLERRRTREAASTLLWLVAVYGHEDRATAQAAFERGIEALGTGGRPADTDLSILDSAHALRQLRGLIGRDLERLIQALITTISHDGRISVAESEFMRMVSVALNCPLPPVIDGQVAAALVHHNGTD